MKQLKRTPNIFKSKNVVFDSSSCRAYSYSWWRFVDRVDGKIIFNSYRYSVTTAKHQRAVKGLLGDLGIKIDIDMPVPRGLQQYGSLAEAIVDAEEHLCDQYLESELKRENRNLVSKHKRHAKRLESYLENQCAFRDYEIKQLRQFGHINTVAVHQCINLESLEFDVSSALNSFRRDGFGKVVFYV